MSQAKVKIVSQNTIHEVEQGKESEVVSPLAQPSADGVIHANTNTGKKVAVSNASKFLFKYGHKQNYGTGQYIIREGNLDKTVYILLQGEVEVVKSDATGKDTVVATLAEGGTILGEMSIFLEAPRSTSVRISQDSQLLEFTGENFLKAVVNIPELSMRILKSLSAKLKNTNEQVVQNYVCESCKSKKKPGS